MRKIITIARREFTAMVATKAFVLTLVMMPILMLGGIVLIPALSRLSGQKDRRIVVADASGKLLNSIQEAAENRNKAILDAVAANAEIGRTKGQDPFSGLEILNFEAAAERVLTDKQRLTLSDQIRDGDLYALVEIPADIGDSDFPAKAKFVSQDAALSGARRWLENHLQNHFRVTRLSELGIDPELVAGADAKVSLEPTSLYTEGEDGKAISKGGADTLASLFLPFGIMMLMFMVIFMAAQPMLESGMEEKQHRIAELLLGSVSPAELMTGKLLGNVAGSFVIFAIYGLGGFIILGQNGWHVNLGWAQMPWLILFQVLGVLFFSSIFLTIGASVSELKEAQSLLLPVWLLLAAPLMVWLIAVRDPNGAVATALSFFPPSAPLMMSLRLSSGQTMPLWHAPLAALLMLIATYAIIRIAGRVYRTSLLKSDSAASFRKLLQRLRGAE
jgi:ABC-2 type transport system permease protein